MSGISEPDLAEVANLLRIPAQKRMQRDIQRIAKLTKHVKFFSEYDPSVHEACCRHMKHAEYPAGVYIFKKGAPGDSFCIILRGRVGVLIPTSRLTLPTAPQTGTRSQAAVTVKRRLLTLTRSLFAVTTLKRGSIILKELPVFAQVTDETPEECDQIEVSELSAGASFGELSLLQDLPRSASIFCKEPTVLAVLSKDSFNIVLKDFEARKLNEKIAFLRSIPAFETWSRQALSKLTYYLKERRFKRAQSVFQESDPSTEVYIVLEGEFKITKTCRLHRETPEKLGQKSTSTQAQLQLVIKGPGEMFGEQEVLGDQPRGTNCACISSTGKLWVIAKFDFMRRLSSTETWNFIYKKDEIERKWMHDRLDQLLDIEVMKLKPTTDPPKKEVSVEGGEVTVLRDSLKKFSNTVLDGAMIQRERSEERKALLTSPRYRVGMGRMEKGELRGCASARGLKKMKIFLRKVKNVWDEART